MRRVVRAILTALAIAALTVLPASAVSTTPTFSTVIVVLAPYLTWHDIDATRTPALWHLAEDAALGNASVIAGSVAPAPDAFRGAAVLAAGQPVSAVEARADASGSTVGLLGTAVRQAGGRTAAIGTSAATPSEALSPSSAAAWVVARDATGTVDFAETSARIVRRDPLVPTGIVTDLDVLEVAYRSALAGGEPGGAGPLLIVLDPGDAERARSALRSDVAWESSRITAIGAIDDTVRIALRSLPSDGALIVVSTGQYSTAGPAGFGPVLLYGAGPGVLRSPGTHRDGIVTLPDVTATVLHALALDVPSSVTGEPLLIVAEDQERAERLAGMTRTDAAARALESTRAPVWTGVIGISIVLLALVLVAVLRPGARPSRSVRLAAAYALVVACSVPAGTLVAQAVGYPVTASAAWIRLGLGIGVVIAASVWKSRGPGHALGRVSLLTVAVVLIDQALGGPAAQGSAFSYSALFGTRFYGLGNEGAAVLAGAALAAVGSRIDTFGVSRVREYLWLGGLIVVVAVLPVLGANIGVAAWGTAGFVAAYLAGAGRRLDWKVGLASVIGAAAVLGVAALIDRMAAGSSHLGRVLGGSGGLGPMLARKAELSLRILTATPAVVLLPLGIGAIVYVLVKRVGPLGEIVGRRRGVAAALVGAVTAAVVGLLTEDSGVALSALVMLFPAAALASAFFEREGGADEY
ncbi:MAG: hypothetical protein Q7W44_08025 [Coriobacteriia bacterium]|nr:hypothetical protein [Coriobacteriia bacterium]